MNKPLIDPKSTEGDEELEALVAFYNETLGFCPNSVKTMHYRPAMAKAFIELNKQVMACHGRVNSALKRMIAYISSYTTGCRYCQAHAIKAAERYGAEEEKLRNIWSYTHHPVFTEAEKAALDYARAASVIPNGVDEEVAENLRKHWDEGEITEITGVISLFGFLTRWNDSMGTQLEEGARETGEEYLKDKGWTPGKHG